MKFTLENAEDFGWERLKGKAYSSKEDFENASTAYFEVSGSHGRVKTTRSDRVYFVIDGQGEFDVDSKIFTVSKNDVVIVPKNIPYDYKAVSGTLKLFLVHTPAYDPDSEIKL